MHKKVEAAAKALRWRLALRFGSVLAVSWILVACNTAGTKPGNSPGTAPGAGMGTVSVMVSDSATCRAPEGPYSHVYVTIADVQANTSSTAGASASGWVDLTPSLSKAPVQIDLMGQTNSQCFLATLANAQPVQAGAYAQFRVLLAANSASMSSNACSSASAANCVVLAADASVHALDLSSESQTGIEVPSGQIAGTSFTIAAGQTASLAIDFNICESIVEASGQYGLKPVLHAGVLSTAASISGTVLDYATGNPVSGTVTVAAEQKDENGVDRIIMSKVVNADGSFVLCPLSAADGNYDLVMVGTRASDGAFYAPSIVTGVSVGSATGNVNLYLPAAATTSSATFTGQATSQNISMAGTAADVQLSGLETVSGATYTIPLPPTSTQSTGAPGVETAASTSALACASGTDCVAIGFTLPSDGPYAGAWSSGGTTLAQSAPLASYAVDGIASVPSSGGMPDCSPAEMTSQANTLSGAGPYSVTGVNLSFTSCQ
jgi:hypothetical protein